MSLITLNYELAIAQAVKLERAADECASMVNDVNTQIEVLRSAWSGDAASRMIELLEQWKKDTAASETELRNLAKRVRSKANAIKAADEANATATEQSGDANEIALRAAEAGKNLALNALSFGKRQ